MRTVLVSLIALAGLATTAVAQPAEAPTAQPPTPPPAAPPAPPAATPPATTPPVAPTDPGAVQAAPAPEPALPQRPTSGDGAVVLDIIERVCVPLVRGGNQDQLARAYGMRKQRRDNSYTMTLGQKPYQVTLHPQRSDKNTCELTIEHKIDGDEEIAKALHTWAFLHQPELKPYRSDIRPEPVTNNQLTTRSWEHFTETDSIGLVFVKQRKADGTPLGRNVDRSKVLYQERKLTTGT